MKLECERLLRCNTETSFETVQLISFVYFEAVILLRIYFKVMTPDLIFSLLNLRESVF